MFECWRPEFSDSTEVALELCNDLLVILTYLYVTDGFFQGDPSCYFFMSSYTRICNVRIDRFHIQSPFPPVTIKIISPTWMYSGHGGCSV
jgi:hypothetical protein